MKDPNSLEVRDPEEFRRRQWLESRYDGPIKPSLRVMSFNTGRYYSPQGQRIAYTVVGQKPDPFWEGVIFTVAFADLDRGIDGTLEIMDVISQERLLSAYDMGGYGDIEDPQLRSILYTEAANAPTI